MPRGPGAGTWHRDQADWVPVSALSLLCQLHTGPHTQEGPTLGFPLCCCHFAIPNNLWTGGTRFFAVHQASKRCSQGWLCIGLFASLHRAFSPVKQVTGSEPTLVTCTHEPGKDKGQLPQNGIPAWVPPGTVRLTSIAALCSTRQCPPGPGQREERRVELGAPTSHSGHKAERGFEPRPPGSAPLSPLPKVTGLIRISRTIRPGSCCVHSASQVQLPR